VSERPKQGLLYALAALIFIEGAALAAATVYLVVEIIIAPSASVASAVALAVCAAIASAGLILIGRSTLKCRPWIRGASVAWQVIQVLVGYSILQAHAPTSTLIFWVLLVPAVAIIVLLFTPQVVRLTTRSRES
jgi:hypothetical protein